MPFSNFIWWKAIIVLIFISEGFWPSVSFFSIFLLEDNDNDQFYTIITTRYSRLQASPNFLWKLFSIEIPRSSILGEIKFDSLVHLILKCLLGYMIIDHIALTTTRKVNFMLFDLPGWWWLSCVWPIAAFIPWTDMRKCFPLLVSFEVIQYDFWG